MELQDLRIEFNSTGVIFVQHYLSFIIIFVCLQKQLGDVLSAKAAYTAIAVSTITSFSVIISGTCILMTTIS